MCKNNPKCNVENYNFQPLSSQWFSLSRLHVQQRIFVLLNLCFLHLADHIRDDYYYFIITHFAATGFVFYIL